MRVGGGGGGGGDGLQDVGSGTPYNHRVVAFMRQPNVIEVMKEKATSILTHKSLRDKVNLIRHDGCQGLERLSADVELILLLR